MNPQIPTPRLTISDLLQKHFPQTEKQPYGQVKRNAAFLGCTERQFRRWLNKATSPNSEQTIEILRRTGELKRFPADPKTK